MDHPGDRDLMRHRERFTLTPDAFVSFKKCFADIEPEKLKDLISVDDRSLTVKGTSDLAERMNKIFQGDEDVAIAIRKRIIDPQLMSDQLGIGLKVDYEISKTLPEEQKEQSEFLKLDTKLLPKLDPKALPEDISVREYCKRL